MAWYKYASMLDDLKKRYENQYPAQEAFGISLELNMTSRLPMPQGDQTILQMVDRVSDTRGFHLNTLIGRMFKSWANMKLQPRFDLINEDVDDPEAPEVKAKLYMYSDPETNIPNKKYQAAYKIWKDYIRAAVSAVPAVKQRDIHTNADIDVLIPARKILNAPPGNGGVPAVLKNMQEAYKIYISVHGGGDWASKDGIRNYANFMEIMDELFPQNKEFEDKARDYWEAISGNRELPQETNERFVKDHRDIDVPLGLLEEEKINDKMTIFKKKQPPQGE